MSDAPDFRVLCSIFDHPKWIRLESIGSGKLPLHMLKLWGWVRANRSSGSLKGMAVAEIEHAARWRGRRGKFVATLKETGWLDGEDGRYVIHGWEKWQGYATGSAARQRAGQIGAIIKQCLRLGVHPDDYLDDVGGHQAQDIRLRERLRVSWAKSKKAKAIVRSHSDGSAAAPPSDTDRTLNARAPTDPVSDPVPNGGRGGSADAAPPAGDGRAALPQMQCPRCGDEIRYDYGGFCTPQCRTLGPKGGGYSHGVGFRPGDRS